MRNFIALFYCFVEIIRSSDMPTINYDQDPLTINPLITSDYHSYDQNTDREAIDDQSTGKILHGDFHTSGADSIINNVLISSATTSKAYDRKAPPAIKRKKGDTRYRASSLPNKLQRIAKKKVVPRKQKIKPAATVLKGSSVTKKKSKLSADTQGKKIIKGNMSKPNIPPKIQKKLFTNFQPSQSTLGSFTNNRNFNNQIFSPERRYFSNPTSGLSLFTSGIENFPIEYDILPELYTGTDELNMMSNPKISNQVGNGLFTSCEPCPPICKDVCEEERCYSILKNLERLLVEKLAEYKCVFDKSIPDFKHKLKNSFLATTKKIENAMVDASRSFEAQVRSLIDTFDTKTSTSVLQEINTNNNMLQSGIVSLLSVAESNINNLIINLSAQTSAIIIASVQDLTTSAGLLSQLNSIINVLSMGISTLFSTQLPIEISNINGILNSGIDDLSLNIFVALKKTYGDLMIIIINILANELENESKIIQDFTSDIQTTAETILMEHGKDIVNLVRNVFCYDICSPEPNYGAFCDIAARVRPIKNNYKELGVIRAAAKKAQNALSSRIIGSSAPLSATSQLRLNL